MATKIGKWVVTTKEHSCLARTFVKGTLVKVVDSDNMRGYTIEDKSGNRISEIGWII